MVRPPNVLLHVRYTRDCVLCAGTSCPLLHDTAVCLSFSYHHHWLPDLASLHARAGPHVVYVWFTYVPHTSLSRWDYYLSIDAQCWVNVSLFYTFEFYNLAIHRTSKYFNQNINTYRSVAFIECNPRPAQRSISWGRGYGVASDVLLSIRLSTWGGDFFHIALTHP